MRALISLLVSISVFFSSSFPLFAQASQIGRGLVRLPSLTKGVAGLSKATRLSTVIQQGMTQQIRLAGLDIPQLMLAGKTTGLSTRILNLPTASQLRIPLLQNQFVRLGLMNQVSLAEKQKALTFYKEDLSTIGDAFKPNQNLSLDYLLTEGKPSVLLQYRKALSDAAAIGLLGTKEEAPLLIEFYQKIKGTAFEPVGSYMVARSLLRMEAYDTFNAWSKTVEQKGEFWQNLATYAKAHNLPIEVTPIEGKVAPLPSNLGLFLRTGNEFNELSADVSLAATEKWIGLNSSNIPALKEETAEVYVENPTLSTPISLETSIPSSLVMEDISLTPNPIETPSFSTEEPVAPVTEIEEVSTLDTPSQSGILYGGIPVFALGKTISKAFNKIKGLFTHTHYDFNLTVANEQGQEDSLGVNLEIQDSVLKDAHKQGYDRVVLAFNPHFHNGYIAQLRGAGKEPKTLEHFHIRLQSEQVGSLVKLAKQYGKPGEKFLLKIEKKPNVSYETVSLPLYGLDGEIYPVSIEMPAKDFTEGAKLVLLEDGSLGLLKEGESVPEELSGYYVRLPKNQLATFINLVKNSKEPFNVSLRPTQDRANIIVRDASLTNVSLGKTMGPVVNGALNISEGTATGLMFTINYILPGFASLLTPVLKKYGEKNLMTVSLGMSTAAGILASMGGFYGFVDGMTLNPIQKGLFVTALFLMSGSSILKQLVSNMLIRANRGEVVLEKTAQEIAKTTTAVSEEEKVGLAQIGSRIKNIFTTKSDVSLKDIILYNLSFVYKNVGTLAFLASPYLINTGIQLATGVDLGLDYSISFPIYAAFSGLTAWKVYRAKLRDAYSAKNLIQSENTLTKAIEKGVDKLMESSAKGMVSHTDIDDVARTMKNAMDDLSLATFKMNPDQVKKEIFSGLKENALDVLETQLIEKGMGADQAHSLVIKVASSLNRQSHVLGNLWETFKLPGVAALASAMTLATVHEFVVSSSFASTLKVLISQGEWANFLVASSLYVPLIIGRMGGNFVSRYISSGSMYLLCSVFSAIGTAVMATAGASVAQTIAGAAIASIGMGNYFTQMYDYIMKKNPKQNREISSVLALTMGLGGLGAIPAGYMAGLTGMPTSNLLYAGVALGASLLLTPGIMESSTLFKVGKYEWKKFTNWIKGLFKGKGNGGDVGNGNPVLAE